MRDWASSYGAAVQQRTVRQETKHGSLPENMYQRQCIASEEPVVIAFNTMQDDKVSKCSDAIERDSEEVEEFDTSGDEEVEAGSADQRLKNLRRFSLVQDQALERQSALIIV